jgi:hypothetical protein
MCATGANPMLALAALIPHPSLQAEQPDLQAVFYVDRIVSRQQKQKQEQL